MSTRARPVVVYALVVLVGAAAFLYPFFLPATALPSRAHSGDAPLVAAIVGALVGARVGKEGIPAEWLRDLWEWPRTPGWIERLAARLAQHAASRTNGEALPLNAMGLALRNVLFIPLVLAHGFRRLLPPY
jgi:hypothetical protein